MNAVNTRYGRSRGFKPPVKTAWEERFIEQASKAIAALGDGGFKASNGGPLWMRTEYDERGHEVYGVRVDMAGKGRLAREDATRIEAHFLRHSLDIRFLSKSSRGFMVMRG